MADILDHYNLQSNASRNGHAIQVGFNQRRIIESILAHYSSDFVVFRELIQNADDARATSFHLDIKCDASSSSSVEMDFQNRTITEFRMINNGNIFSETDWKRVATIADGNTDPQSVGQFGVGFFAAFSYTEEPIIASGNEYMIFVWQDDKLISIRHKLPVEQQSKSTTIILKMRDKHVLRIESALDNSKGMNEDMSTINLAQLKAYFAKVLSFTRHIVNLEIKINCMTVFQISKTKSIAPSIQDAFTFESQPSIHNMLLLDSVLVTEQTFTIANGPSITLDHMSVEACLNVDQQFHNYIQRIFKKSLPYTVQIQLLFVPTNVIINRQQLQSSKETDNLNTQILNSLLPLTFLDNEIIPSGLIFIGLGTDQSIGIGMHVYSNFIPTVERVNLNLQDPYIAKWNKELLASVGQMARCIYDQSIFHSWHSKSDKNYDALITPYSFQPTGTNEKGKVGDIVRNGFFASKNNILVPVKRLPSDKHLSVVSSTQAFLADSKHIHEFLSIPLVPFELAKNQFFTALKERRLINIADKSIVEKQLVSSILLCDELIELLKWLCSNNINDRSYIKRVLSIVHFRETVNSPVTSFGQMKYYDASSISLTLPLPTNVLPTSIAGYFPQEQLHHNLFLLPCTFKDLINFYLLEKQHYLFLDPKTATSLLSHLSKDSSHFSERQWAEIKSILSVLKCIPTTQGMKLPNESYMPSYTLTPDLPAIKLNLLPDKATNNQTDASNSDENLVSVHFLKQIGCRMINIQSIIDYSRRNADNMTALNSETMQLLIENLIKERNNMSDTDFDDLRHSKFLQGTTLTSAGANRQMYFPQDLHFPFVAEKLKWPALLILDWHGIAQHSPEYAFLKELGVREVPDLKKLINRIVYEHDKRQQRQSSQPKTKYKLSIALQFFAENFQKHYSTLWKTSNIQQPFLPSRLLTKNGDVDIILSVPEKVFIGSNPLYAILLPEVVRLFQKHYIILLLGIIEHPTLTQAFDIVMERKNELLTVDKAGHIFAYLNGLAGLNQLFIKRLSNIAFIPLKGAPTLMKPSRVFIQQLETPVFKEIDTSSLVDYVDFGAEANSFLLAVGVVHFPSISMLAELLIERQENYFANLTDKDSILTQKLHVYTQCLKRIALASTQTPELHRAPLGKRLKTERWCLGFRPVDCSNNGNCTFEIVKPTEIYLDDDHQCVLSHRPICPPNEPEVTKLYEQFGAKWLSECVSRKLVHSGTARSTDRGNQLQNLIESRLNMLFVDIRGNPMANLNEEHFQLLSTKLSVYEVKNIKCRLTFQNKTITLDAKDGSSCALQQKKNEVILYFRKDLLALDYIDIASELARFVFKSPPETVVHTISDRLSSSLDSLRRRGIPVDRLLMRMPQVVSPTPQEQPKNSTSLWTKFRDRGGSTGNDEPPSPVYDDPPPPAHVRQYDHDHDVHGNGQVERHPVIVPTKDFRSTDTEINNNKMHRLIGRSRAYPGSNFIQKGHVRNELSESCELVPDANMKRLEDVDISIPLFVEQNVRVTDTMINQAKQLAWILTGLAKQVFKFPIDSLHLFRDIDGSRIAFNAQGALFFNLRYFEQIYADKLQAHLQRPTKSNPIVTTIINFYFMVTCHELVHNINPTHDLNFVNDLQQCAIKFMVEKEVFLAQFSFDSLAQNAVSYF